MSESFSDLWVSSNPVKSQQPQSRTLGVAASSSSNVALRATPDAFSMLASAGSQPNSRPITPSMKHPVTKNGTTTGDAFGGLVSFGNSTSHDGGLTIAERAAKAERELIERTEKDEVTFNVQASFWDKYEGIPTGTASIPDSQVKSNGLLDLDFLTPEHTLPTSEMSQAPKSAEHTDHNDTWDLDFVAPKHAVNVVPPATVLTDIFDLDHLDTLGTVPVGHSTEPSRPNTPGSFDFGDREDQLLGAIESQGEDDILGSLAKPVEAVKGVSSKPTVPSRSHTSFASPPPHIVERIVEMGFSVQQAKVALATTSTGLDVDVALEILLQGDGSAISEERREDTIHAIEVEHKLRRRQGPSRVTAPATQPSPLSIRSESPLTYQQGLQEQADKLLAQASTIGMTVFSKANAFWKESREKVVKVYEEQSSGSTGADAGKGKGRPRWMDNASLGEDGNKPPADEYQDRSHNDRISIQPLRSTPDPRRSKPSVSLLNDESVYRSPARRRPPLATASTSKALSPSPISTSTALPLIVRPTIEASPSALAASGTHKVAGTEHFRLGHFAEAESAYSRAIDVLPASHLLCIPLYNNRALTRLKTGDYKGTIGDTSEVLRIVTGDIGTAWHPGREEAGVRDNFGDAIGKALRRRAEAYEGLEKWKEAVGDWERLSAATWAGLALKGDAVKGAGRCRQMASGESSSTKYSKIPSKPKPHSKSTPTQMSPSRPSVALTRVRAANMAQEKEEQARHDLKDVVDARLAAWRTGKENNLRALIASLDVVLSSTFKWQTVGMSELVSPGQVKVKYTKAIAKLHPDKLNVNNTTLEERMIANSVFGILNEAWNAFR